MSLSEATIVALRADLQRLEAEHDALREKISAIRRLLGVQDPSGESDTSERELLRDVLLNIIKQQGPMKAAQVTGILRERGFIVPGKTDLHHRVYNEFFRLMRNGVVNRRKTGEFEIAM
jgi:hypothetical protein